MPFIVPFYVAFSFGACAAPAVTEPQATVADTVFYDAKAQQLRSRVGAVRLIVTSSVPAGGVIQRIYAPNGALLEAVPYADAQAVKREGAALRWFPSGEMRGRRTYKAGQLEGQAVVYYPGGTIQQLSLYQQGQEKSRQCFERSGQLIDCPVETSVGRAYAEYHLGEVMLAREVQRATHYPAMPEGAEPLRGQVVVACAIGVDGKMRETRIYKGMGPAYDRDALRVVNGLRGSFSPQLQDGEPVESFYTLGVDFIPPVPR